MLGIWFNTKKIIFKHYAWRKRALFWRISIALHLFVSLLNNCSIFNGFFLKKCLHKQLIRLQEKSIETCLCNFGKIQEWLTHLPLVGFEQSKWKVVCQLKYIFLTFSLKKYSLIWKIKQIQSFFNSVFYESFENSLTVAPRNRKTF